MAAEAFLEAPQLSAPLGLEISAVPVGCQYFQPLKPTGTVQAKEERSQVTFHFDPNTHTSG